MGRTARADRGQSIGVNGEDQSPGSFSAIASILTTVVARKAFNRNNAAPSVTNRYPMVVPATGYY